MRALLLTNYPKFARCLRPYLEASGFEVEADGNVDRAALAKAGSYDLIILDLEPAGEDRLAQLRNWRESGVRSHIAVLTMGEDIQESVAALDNGADLCLPKPFQVEELLARLRALTRRRRPTAVEEDSLLKVHDLEIDTEAHIVRRGGQNIRLTPREYALLEFLACHKGKVVSRAKIFEQVYHERDRANSNVVDVYIRYLREKIDKGFSLPLILTARGRGYLLREDGNGNVATPHEEWARV